jgi:hypothetical protein
VWLPHSGLIHTGCSLAVMAGLVPAIYVVTCCISDKTWMPATSAGMTAKPLRSPQESRVPGNPEQDEIGACGVVPVVKGGDGAPHRAVRVTPLPEIPGR